MERIDESCPCCGERKPLGLFDVHPALEAPLVVELALKDAERPRLVEHDALLSCNGRWFLPALLNLPVNRLASPVGMRVWIEVNSDQIEAIQAVQRKDRRQTSGLAQIACELPGFVGTVGSPCRFRFRNGQSEATIVSVADRRIADIPDDASHEQLAELYRRIWGNTEPLIEPDLELREIARAGWRQIIGRVAYSRPVPPPPPLAGSTPAEILISPPLDTGEPAFLATVGAAEAAAEETGMIEIAAWIRNPSEDVVRCFSEFSYLTRVHAWEEFEGRLLMEQGSIPDTDEALVAWLLVSPWWLDEIPAPSYEGEEIRLLAAVPLHAEEVNYAGVHGIEALVQELQASDEDLTDLNRNPTATLARET